MKYNNIITWGLYLTIISFALIITSCKKSEGQIQKITGNVELYILDDYTTMNNSCQIVESSITLRDTAVLVYSDIISYNPAKYEFDFIDAAIEKVNDINQTVFGTAFAIIANDSLVYTGYFIPLYSSTGCAWTIINLPLGNPQAESVLKVKIGYPGPQVGINIPDKRNDPRLMEILKNDGKLR
jgi:hypothetical protein